jgi:hypothetical protein
MGPPQPADVRDERQEPERDRAQPGGQRVSLAHDELRHEPDDEEQSRKSRAGRDRQRERDPAPVAPPGVQRRGDRARQEQRLGVAGHERVRGREHQQVQRRTGALAVVVLAERDQGVHRDDRRDQRDEQPRVHHVEPDQRERTQQQRQQRQERLAVGLRARSGVALLGDAGVDVGVPHPPHVERRVAPREEQQGGRADRQPHQPGEPDQQQRRVPPAHGTDPAPAGSSPPRERTRGRAARRVATTAITTSTSARAATAAPKGP